MTRDYDREDAKDIMAPTVRGPQSDEGLAVEDLGAFHDAATSFLALYSQHTEYMGVPEDLDADTKRQLSTARTMLYRAVVGIENTAVDRLNDLDPAGDDGEDDDMEIGEVRVHDADGSGSEVGR